MSNSQLPDYIASAKPNPAANRAPWYKNTAPAYAGIFLSVPFMAGMAGALAAGSITAAIIGLFMGAMFCLVIYYVPAKLGMKTGMPLYVAASSTFGTQGGILVPGLLMGIVQIFWHAVFTTSAAGFFMQAIGKGAPVKDLATMPLFWVSCAVLGLIMAFVGAVGIGLLGKLSSFLPIAPLLFIIIAAISNFGGISDMPENITEANYQQKVMTLAKAELMKDAPIVDGEKVAPEDEEIINSQIFKDIKNAAAVGGIKKDIVNIPMSVAMFAALAAAAGFFASAGVAGSDFGMNSRNEKDVALGGFVGVTGAALVAGILAIIAIAGAAGKNPDIAATIVNGDVFGAFFASIDEIGKLAKISAWIFVIACICPLGFCAFLAANAFSTMLPKIPRVPMTMVAGVIGVILAATGIADNLVGFFLMVGAAFGPIAGVMLADYVRNGGWAGPRTGVNLAGYIAWFIGLLMGLLGPITGGKLAYGLEPLIAMVVAAAAYFVLAAIGLEPESVELPSSEE